MNFADLRTGTMFKTADDRMWMKVNCMATGYYYNAQQIGYNDTYYLQQESIRVIFEDDQEIILI